MKTTFINSFKLHNLYPLLFVVLFSACSDDNGQPQVQKKQTQAPKVISKPSPIIYVQPFTYFPKERVELIKRELKKFYKLDVVVLPVKDIYASARLEGTDRYAASIILDLLQKDLNKPKDKILGLTSYDIYDPKEVDGVEYPYWGIFGLGMMDAMPCVVSDFRLIKFKNKTNDFVVNVVLHEIGHTFNLDHCDKDERCLMNDAKGTIETLYKEQKWLCPACVKKIQKKGINI